MGGHVEPFVNSNAADLLQVRRISKFRNARKTGCAGMGNVGMGNVYGGGGQLRRQVPTIVQFRNRKEANNIADNLCRLRLSHTGKLRRRSNDGGDFLVCCAGLCWVWPAVVAVAIGVGAVLDMKEGIERAQRVPRRVNGSTAETTPVLAVVFPPSSIRLSDNQSAGDR